MAREGEGGRVPDGTRSEYDATWIQVAAMFDMNVHTVTHQILLKIENKSKMRQTKQTTAESWVSHSQVSETRNTTGT